MPLLAGGFAPRRGGLAHPPMRKPPPPPAKAPIPHAKRPDAALWRGRLGFAILCGAMRILVLNGPNLNLLGLREPELYGSRTYADLVEYCMATAAEAGAGAEVRQTNHEGTLVDWIQEARGKFDALVLNAAAYTHTSVAILDALKATRIPTAEVHLTEPKSREGFRRVSYVGMAAERTFSGLGFESYGEAIRHFAAKAKGA